MSVTERFPVFHSLSGIHTANLFGAICGEKMTMTSWYISCIMFAAEKNNKKSIVETKSRDTYVGKNM